MEWKGWWQEIFTCVWLWLWLALLALGGVAYLALSVYLTNR